ncbi:MAG TPA: hypothetical protein PLQ38_07910 [Methanothrix sp.]|nr:hypothetical protein [Methanothrix sp.]
MISIEPEHGHGPAYQGSQLFAQLGRKSEFSIGKFRYTLTVFDIDIKKLVALLHILRKATWAGVEDRLKCVAVIEHYW